MDKLFLELSGWPVVGHTWRRFDGAACIDEVVLVIRPDQETAFRGLADRMQPVKPFRLVAGGAQRQDSVWNGLGAIAPRTELVAIQDGARPCITVDLIERTLVAAQEVGAAVAAQRLTDTIKESSDGRLVSRHLDRSLLWSVQTPQCFRVTVINQALSAVREHGLHITDDTAACELIGQPVCLVEADRPNPKLTAPGDLSYIQMLLDQVETSRG